MSECQHVRGGQSTDAVPAGFTQVGSETNLDRRMDPVGLYRCLCGQLWSGWYLSGAYVWGQAEEPLSERRWRMGWRYTYTEPWNRSQGKRPWWAPWRGWLPRG